MRRQLFIAGIAALCTTPYAVTAQSVPAFPGAEGFGAKATGGRGGEVYHVTNLADSGPGSFRDAVSKEHRIVVFDVGGYASPASATPKVNAAIKVSSHITIAGQTAPGDGFGVMGREVSFSEATNVICRFVRFRQGLLDGHHAGNGVGMYRSNSIILDHVSIGFGQWNNIDAVAAKDITVQNCIIANPIGQRFGAHTEDGPFCWYRNLWTNAHNRQVMARADTVFVNNLVYNFEAAYTTTTHKPFHHDLVNNCFVAGPSTHRATNCFFQVNTDQLFYTAGNLLDANRNGRLDGAEVSPGAAVTNLDKPFFPETGRLPLMGANAAARCVLSHAGCSLRRDALDVQTVGDALSLGKAGFIFNDQEQSGLPNSGYGTLKSAPAPTDTDHDGMPDYYERALGWNPALDDHNTPLPSKGGVITEPTFLPPGSPAGYTRLDEYLHFLAIPHGTAARGSAGVAIDLKPFTSAFSNAPVFKVSNVVGGSVTLGGAGNSVATFRPAVNYVGRAKFDFTVADADGNTWTQTYALLVQ
jgi:hypothetical protein